MSVGGKVLTEGEALEADKFQTKKQYLVLTKRLLTKYRPSSCNTALSLPWHAFYPFSMNGTTHTVMYSHIIHLVKYLPPNLYLTHASLRRIYARSMKVENPPVHAPHLVSKTNAPRSIPRRSISISPTAARHKTSDKAYSSTVTDAMVNVRLSSLRVFN